MEITKDGEQKFITVGDIKIPIREMLLDIIEDVKKLTRDQWELIIRDGGVEVPAGMEDRDLLHLAMSFAQNAWYTETQGEVSQGIKDGHAARLEKFAKLAAAVKARPPQIVVPKEPKAPKEPKPPKEPKAPKAVVAKTVTVFSLNPTGDAVIASNLTGFRKSFYATLQAAGAEAKLTRDEVLAQTIADGAQFKTDGAAQSQVNYQLKELVGCNLVVKTEVPV